MRNLTGAALLLVIALGACVGGWEDAPLEPGIGEVSGRFQGPVDASRAWVIVRAQPLAAADVDVDAAGHFLLRGIASGRAELVGSDGRGGAFAETVTVYASRRVELEVAASAGAALTGLATLEGLARPLPVALAIEGLPVSITTDEEGRFTIGGLPPGCHVIVGARAGWTTTRRQACAQGAETAWAPLHLRRDPASPAPRAICESCDDSGQCADGSCAALEAGGARVCTRPCEADADCPSGLSCREAGAGSFCAPLDVSCGTFVDTSSDKACEEDSDCGESEDERARCVALRCTQACEDDDECPLGRVCDLDGESDGACL